MGRKRTSIISRLKNNNDVSSHLAKPKSSVPSLSSSGGPSSSDFTEKINRRLTDSHDCGLDEDLHRALNEQNFTLNKLNLSGIELYGRERELASLNEALEAALDSTSSRCRMPGMVHVFGPAGSGKTRLTQEFKWSVNKKEGFFCTGKFDLRNRYEPYTAFVSALADLTRQILTKGAEFQKEISALIRDAIGDEFFILTSLVPELVELIGAGGDANHHGHGEDALIDAFTTRTNRLHYFFRQFIGAVCSPNHPLVIVLDDMQWSDISSLSLITNLVTDCSLYGFLLVTTCREGEMDKTHPFEQHLEAFRNDNIPVQTIPIGNLDQSAVLSIVSTALRSSEETTFKLSEIVHHKSCGNPMYVIQFLTALYDEGLLQYNIGSMRWIWEETKVRTRFVVDNVADLTAAKVKRLPLEFQTILQIASCLGQTFDSETLESVVQAPRVREVFADNDNDIEKKNCWPADLVASLDGLVAEGVVDYIPQLNCFCFAHDLIQDAAFHLIPEGKRSKMQSEVGQCLLSCVDPCRAPNLCDQYYYRAVDLSNAGSALLKEDELLSLAKHNLQAGQKAMSKAAFPSALKYLEEGLRCLGPDGWIVDPPLALALTSSAVEASYCCGDFETMESHMASVLNRDIPIGDKVRVYLIRILSLGAQDCNAAALETGRRVLIEMGVTRLPKNPGLYHAVGELLKTKVLFRNQNHRSLVALPTLDDKKWMQATSIVDMMMAIAYTTNIYFFSVMNHRMLRWAVIHGVCQYTPTVLSAYGTLLCFLGSLDSGRMYGSVALTLTERLNARSTQAKTIIAVYGFIHHWTANLRTCLKPLLYGHKLGMETGEVEIAMYNLSQHGEALLSTAATPLKNLVSKMRSNANLMREYKQEGVRNFHVLALQFALKLLGPSDNPTSLTGEVVDEDDARAKAKEKGTALLGQFLENYCLMLAYHFDDYERADHFSRVTHDFPTIAMGHLFVIRNMFFRGLTALALAGKGCRRRQNMAAAAKILSQLKKWSELGNVNCIHMVQLLQAETAAIRNHRDKARHLYEAAINTSGRNGYLNDKALAHERAFLFHLKTETGDHFWAQNHYNDAVQAYCDWNAYEKAKHLIEQHGKLLQLSEGPSSAISAAFPLVGSSSSPLLHLIDMSSPRLVSSDDSGAAFSSISV